jgi:hypothetical protein
MITLLPNHEKPYHVSRKGYHVIITGTSFSHEKVILLSLQDHHIIK